MRASSIKATLFISSLLVAATSSPPSYGFDRPQIASEQTVGDSNFLVHYPPGLESKASSSLQTLANLRTQIPEKLGFTLPPNDLATDPSGDSRFDLYILRKGDSFKNRTTRGGAQSEPLIVDGSAGFNFLFEDSLKERVIAHEYFHTVQQGIDAYELNPDGWWAEITAEWAAHRLFPDPTTIALNSSGGMICKGDPFTGCYDQSYQWWPFAEYLSDRFGPSIIYQIWTKQQELGKGSSSSHATEAIEQVLGSKGTSLSKVFVDYATAVLTEYDFFSQLPKSLFRAFPRKWKGSTAIKKSFKIQSYGFDSLKIGLPTSAKKRRLLATVVGASTDNVRAYLWTRKGRAIEIQPQRSVGKLKFKLKLSQSSKSLSLTVSNVTGSEQNYQAKIEKP